MALWRKDQEMASVPRQEADGMTSEDLQFQTNSGILAQQPTRNARYKNLSSSRKTTSVVKVPSPKYIPHEPVKGAVKAVDTIQTLSPIPKSSPSTMPPSYKSNFSQEAKQQMSSTPIGKPIQSHQMQMDRFKASLVSKESVKVPTSSSIGKENGGETVKLNKSYPQATSSNAKISLQFPATNASTSVGSSYVNTSQVVIDMNTSSKATEQQVIPAISKTDEVKVTIGECRNPPVESNSHMSEEREVEGNIQNNDIEKLQQEKEQLKNDLERQTEINKDLKKLLVASMGDDLHYKFESLVRTRVQLSEEIDLYSRQASKDYENLDHLSIQADVWRSKYKASKLLVNQLREQQSALSQQLSHYQQGIQGMLHERGQLRQSAAQTYRYMKQLQEAFDPVHSAKMVVSCNSNLLELAHMNALLGDAIKFKLIGNVVQPIGAVDLLAGASWTPAEVYAQRVLSGHQAINAKIGSSTEAAAVTKPDYHGRFHPSTSYENITFNCCSRCKGNLEVI